MHQEVRTRETLFFYFSGRQIDVQRRRPVGSPQRARSLRSGCQRSLEISRYHLTGVDQVLGASLPVVAGDKDDRRIEMTPAI